MTDVTWTHDTDAGKFSDVPSENGSPSEHDSTSGDRRTRKRVARRDALLDLAADLVERHGVDGVTMAALAEAADYAPASLYTYFPSRSALLAALQQRALVALGRVAATASDEWDLALEGASDADGRVKALARLWAFGDLFLAAPDEHPREFRLQQELLTSTGVQDVVDAAATVPVAMVVLDVPRRLLAAAVDAGALEGHEGADPLGEPVDGAVVRTLAWLVSLNGALLTDGLPTGLPSTGRALGTEITGALLRGWGAAPDALAAARRLADGLRRHATDRRPSLPEDRP